MPNDIGWGKPYDIESGYGMAAVNGATSGYGTVVINSYSGETNISSQDADSEPSKDSFIVGDPLIYVDGDNMYLFFELNTSISVDTMSYELYVDDMFHSDGAMTMAGINWIAEFPQSGTYVLYLTIVDTNAVTNTYTSNSLTV